MTKFKALYLKVTAFSILGILCGGLFAVSLIYDFQYELTRDHVRFRRGFLSQSNWITSPYGTLKCYLFNVTNAQAFLNGNDSRLRLQQVGPIVYRIEGHNEIIAQTPNTLRYKRIRYHKMRYDAAATAAAAGSGGGSGELINQTVVLPNFILLSTVAKIHGLGFLLRKAFNSFVSTESVFTESTVYNFLWNFTNPALNMISNIMPNIVGNVGFLHNALRNKAEEYEIKIGLNHGFKEFFRIISLNNRTYFPEQRLRNKFLSNSSVYCPIDVTDAFDNSLFTPHLTPNDEFTIVAAESCRTIHIRYKEPAEHLGFSGYRYAFDDRHKTPNCLDNSMSIPLPSGIFDVSPCVTNDVPAAFSAPHFYDTAYNWSQYFEGLSPNEADHDTTIIMEPKTGIPIEEKYRFQYNIPVPVTKEYSKDLRRLSKIILPLFWYEYDLDDLPGIVLFLMRFQLYAVPVLQPILLVVFVFCTFICWMKVYLLLQGRTLKEFIYRQTCEKALEKSQSKEQAETDL